MLFCAADSLLLFAQLRSTLPFLYSGAAPYLFKKNAAFRRQGMRGIRPRAAGPFSDARKGTKSAFKGRRPLKNPAPPDKRSCSGLICTLFRPQIRVGDVQRCCTLPFLRSVPQAAPGCGVSAPARRVPFRMHEKEPKVHIRGYPPYGTPGRVPAFGWVEKTRMSQPAPTCFLSRQAPLARPGLCRKTPLLCARSGWACQLAGEGHTGRGHCPLARKAHPARASRVSALRAESPRSEGRCFGREPKTTCAR